MKDPMRLVDRFCYKHPNFGIPRLMRYLTIANVVFWILGVSNQVLLSYLRFDAALILHGQIWRLFTFMAYPPSMGMLAFLVFYFYYWMGTTLENYWGTARFSVYILLGWLVTVIYGFLCYFLGHYRISITAEYLYLSMFFSYATLFPNQQVLLFFFIPIRMKYLALIDAAYFLLAVIQNPFPVNLLPIVAVLNYLIFFGGTLVRRETGAGHGEFPERVQKDPAGTARESLSAQVRRLRPYRYRLSGPGVPVLLPLRRLPLLLRGSHQQSYSFYRMRG